VRDAKLEGEVDAAVEQAYADMLLFGLGFFRVVDGRVERVPPDEFVEVPAKEGER